MSRPIRIEFEFHAGITKIRYIDPEHYDWAVRVLERHGARITSAYSEL